MQILRSFLNEAGLECKYSMDYVESGVIRAAEETQAFMKYYTWNGYSITTAEDINAAFDVQDEKLLLAEKEYEKVKDAEVISRSLVSTKDMYFGNVSAAATGAKYAYRTVTVDYIKVSTDDTVMFVENEPYVIKLALLTSDGMLVHVDYEGAIEKTFTSGDSFELEQNNVEIAVPAELAEGRYTLVAYISTADGIRSSMPSAFAFEEVHSESLISGATLMTASLGEGKELVLNFSQSSSISISITFDRALSYSELYELVSQGAYEKGAIVKTGAVVEAFNEANSSWIPLDTEATSLSGGTYRIQYENKNADKVVSGTVVITLN